MYYAVEPDRGWPSFTAYLEHLNNQEAAALRDRVVNRYLSPYFAEAGVDTSNPPTPEELLSDEEFFIAYLHSRVPSLDFNEDTERQSFALLNDPLRMKALILSDLQMMWDDLMADEWKRLEPVVRESVEACRQIELRGKTFSEAFSAITGQIPAEHWERKFEDFEGAITFVPSPHLGTSVHFIRTERQAWIFFGVRIPEGAISSSTALSIADLLVRLDALADDTRLHILSLVAEYGELCTPDIMTMLDLTQSTAQRHLNQLVAAGYLVARRKEAAKCFWLNPQRIDSTFQAVKRLVRQ
jgi:hypothetical protein